MMEDWRVRISGSNYTRIPSPSQLQAAAPETKLSEGHSFLSPNYRNSSGSNPVPNPHFRRPGWTVQRTSCSFLCASGAMATATRRVMPRGSNSNRGSCSCGGGGGMVVVAVAVTVVAVVAVVVLLLMLVLVAAWRC